MLYYNLKRHEIYQQVKYFLSSSKKINCKKINNYYVLILIKRLNDDYNPPYDC